MFGHTVLGGMIVQYSVVWCCRHSTSCMMEISYSSMCPLVNPAMSFRVVVLLGDFAIILRLTCNSKNPLNLRSPKPCTSPQPPPPNRPPVQKHVHIDELRSPFRGHAAPHWRDAYSVRYAVHVVDRHGLAAFNRLAKSLGFRVSFKICLCL